jgi:hypothetical protein
MDVACIHAFVRAIAKGTVRFPSAGTLLLQKQMRSEGLGMIGRDYPSAAVGR